MPTNVIISPINDSNIFHFWLLEIIGIWESVWRSKEPGSDFIVILLHYNESSKPHQWRRQFLSSLVGSNSVLTWPEFVELQSKRPMEIVQVVELAGNLMFYDPYTFRNYPANECLMEMSKRVRGSVDPDSEGRIPQVIMEQRIRDRVLADAATGQRLETILSAELPKSAIEFKCVSFESLSFDEQRNCLKQADAFVAAHGAGLTNMVFTPASCCIIEANFRRYWYCDPVCDDHLSGKLQYSERCRGQLTYRPYFHKADFHNMAKLLGKPYLEIQAVDYGGRFLNPNPISKEVIYVDSNELLKRIFESCATKR